MWLKEEMTKRGVGVRELARMADVSSGSVSRVLNQTRGAGPDFCRSVARALEIPEEEVFRRAGLLSKRRPPPGEVEGERLTLRELWDLLSQMSTAEQRDVLRYVRKKQRHTRGRGAPEDEASGRSREATELGK
jgi:transcriptional regulator with XRE-family HTH domain